ncbi:MAG: hypothetical protein NVS4B12_02890 [Ktedonobacteraceae bacterium]
MYTTLCSVQLMLLHQGLALSMAAHDLSIQSFTPDTPQAQGMSAPTFGENCPDMHLT